MKIFSFFKKKPSKSVTETREVSEQLPDEIIQKPKQTYLTEDQLKLHAEFLKKMGF